MNLASRGLQKYFITKLYRNHLELNFARVVALCFEEASKFYVLASKCYVQFNERAEVFYKVLNLIKHVSRVC